MRIGTRRRDFIAVAAATLLSPHRAFAQTAPRRVGVLIGAAPDDPVGLGFADAVRAGLAEEGWVDGRNVVVTVRFNHANRDLSRQYAEELFDLGQDAFVCGTSLNALALKAVTETIPIVFVALQDPIGLGLVESYARPGRNLTGFTNFEPSHGGKFVDLLLEVAPNLTRIGIMYNPDTIAQRGVPVLLPIEDAASSRGVATVDLAVRSVNEIEPAVADLAAPGTGIVVALDNYMFSNRPPILAAINRHLLPAIYPFQNFADEGGLMAYAVNTLDVFRKGGVYAGRILNGASPSTLPVQAPSEFMLVLNLRASEEAGLRFPSTLLATADRFVE